MLEKTSGLNFREDQEGNYTSFKLGGGEKRGTEPPTALFRFGKRGGGGRTAKSRKKGTIYCCT